MKKIIVCLFMASIITGIGVKAYSADKDLMGAQAVVACKAEIKKRLNSPSSAKFPWAVTNYNVNGRTVKVNDSFEAQNAYGVYRRYNYSCTVQITDETSTNYNYVLKNISIW